MEAWSDQRVGRIMGPAGEARTMSEIDGGWWPATGRSRSTRGRVGAGSLALGALCARVRAKNQPARPSPCRSVQSCRPARADLRSTRHEELAPHQPVSGLEGRLGYLRLSFEPSETFDREKRRLPPKFRTSFAKLLARYSGCRQPFHLTVCRNRHLPTASVRLALHPCTHPRPRTPWKE